MQLKQGPVELINIKFISLNLEIFSLINIVILACLNSLWPVASDLDFTLDFCLLLPNSLIKLLSKQFQQSMLTDPSSYLFPWLPKRQRT